MEQRLLDEAWKAFNQAAAHDEKRVGLLLGGKHSLAAAASRKADELLSRAVELEEAAYADTAIAA